MTAAETDADLRTLEAEAKRMLAQIADAERQIEREGAILERETALHALRECHATLSATLTMVGHFKGLVENTKRLQEQAEAAIALNADALAALTEANHVAATAIGLVDPAMRQKPN